MLSGVQDESGFCLDENALWRAAMKRALIGLISLSLMAAIRSDTQGPRDPIAPAVFNISAQPIQLDAENPKRTRLGKLEWLGGWALKSDWEHFGGLSALDVSAGNFVALSDTGAVVRFRQGIDGRFGQASIEPLPDGCSRNFRKADQDSESFARQSPGGPIWAGLEGVNMICAFDSGLSKTRASLRPKAMHGWPRTGGAEAVTWLKDGRFAVFAERAFDDDDPLTPVVLFAGDPTSAKTRVSRLRFRAPKGFRPCDAATLPDGRILILNRRFVLPYNFSAALVIVDPANMKAGAIVTGREIARFAPPVIADNMEAIAIENSSDGPIVWIASDDNFSWLQQNLLLKFRLMD
jgi:hypothetical protein